MGTKKISDLTAVTTLAGGDAFVVEQDNSGGTKKITFTDMISQILANILANNGTTSTAGTKALDAAYGKTLTDTKEDAPTELTQTLEAAGTSVTFTDAAIATSSIVDIYTDTWGLSPTAVSVTTGQAVLTFEPQESDVSVKILVR